MDKKSFYFEYLNNWQIKFVPSRFRAFVLFLCLFSTIKAQSNADTENYFLLESEIQNQDISNYQKKFALTTRNNYIGFTTLTLLDNYLSPLEYDGSGLKIEIEERRFFSPYNPNLSHQSSIGLLLGLTYNPQRTASITYFGLDYAWGTHYHFRPIENLQILTGGLADIGIGAKLNSRNVNNQFNMDLATNINLSAVVLYDFKFIRLQSAFDMPTMGCMFVPVQGASYYEMFDLGNTDNTVHFSSFHNKIGFRQKYTAFFTLKRSVLSLSYGYNYLKYEANNMVFKKTESIISLGWSYDFHIFAGRKRQAPDNFVKY